MMSMPVSEDPTARVAPLPTRPCRAARDPAAGRRDTSPAPGPRPDRHRTPARRGSQETKVLCVAFAIVVVIFGDQDDDWIAHLHSPLTSPPTVTRTGQCNPTPGGQMRKSADCRDLPGATACLPSTPVTLTRPSWPSGAPSASDNMRHMTSRRHFLRTVSTGMVASATAPFASALNVLAQIRRDGAPKHPFTGQLGLQLYSLRHLFAKGDVPGTLAMVKNWGLTNVELAGTYGMTAADYAALLKKTGLRAVSTHGDFNKLAEGADAVIADARTFGVEYLGCAWIPHEDRFTAADADKAVAVFNAAGKKANAAGLRFFYHCHGYEFQHGSERHPVRPHREAHRPCPGRLPDGRVLGRARRRRPGGPVQEIPDRFPLTHIKDMKKGTAVGDPTGHAPDDSNVPLGDGMIDWPPIFRAANKVGTKYHFIEDEAPEAEKQIPKTLQYLAGLRL